MNTFLPQNYEKPQSASRYTKLEQGETRIRILSNSIVGWEYFTQDNKVIRSKEKFSDTPNIQKEGKQKHFWAFIVYNYRTEQIEIAEITQVGIRNSIYDLYMDEDYGDPKGFDLKIKRDGEGIDTKYSVLPSPISEVSKEIKELYSKENIRLEALYDGDDPFNPKIENIEGDVFK